MDPAIAHPPQGKRQMGVFGAAVPAAAVSAPAAKKVRIGAKAIHLMTMEELIAEREACAAPASRISELKAQPKQ
eukprot:gene9144-30413_t